MARVRGVGGGPGKFESGFAFRVKNKRIFTTEVLPSLCMTEVIEELQLHARAALQMGKPTEADVFLLAFDKMYMRYRVRVAAAEAAGQGVGEVALPMYGRDMVLPSRECVYELKRRVANARRRVNDAK